MGTTTIYKSETGATEVEAKIRELLRRWPLEKRDLEIDTRHGRTTVTACGNPASPPLLLFPPENINAIYWLDQVQHYAESHQVFAVDILGEPGRSSQARPRLKGEAWAEWVEDIFNALNIASAALVGASLGAWVCLKFACTWPERVDRIALISPPGIVRRQRSRSFLMTTLALLTTPLGQRLIFNSQLKNSGLDPKIKGILSLAQRRRKSRSARLPRFTNRELGQLFCPVLLLLGGRDPYFNTDAIVLRTAKGMPQVEINYRNREGHFLSDFTREIKRFLVSNYLVD